MAPRVMWAVFTVAVLLVCGAVGAVGAEGADARMDPSPAVPGLQEHNGREGRDPVLREVVQALHDHEELAGVAGALDARGRDVLHAILRAEASPPAQYTSSAVRGEMDSAEDGGTTGSRDVDDYCSGLVEVETISGRINTNPGVEHAPVDNECTWRFAMPELVDLDYTCLHLTFVLVDYDIWGEEMRVVSGDDITHVDTFADLPFVVTTHGETTVEWVSTDFSEGFSWGVIFDYEVSSQCDVVHDPIGTSCAPYTHVDSVSGEMELESHLTYARYQECTWSFRPPVSTRCMLVSVSEFLVDFSVDIELVVFREGEVEPAYAKAVHTLDVLATVNMRTEFPTDRVELRLESHDTYDGVYNVEWAEVDCYEFDHCSGTSVRTQTNGTFESNTAGHSTPADLHCQWRIEPEQTSGGHECVHLHVDPWELASLARLSIFEGPYMLDPHVLMDMSSEGFDLVSWSSVITVVFDSGIYVSQGRGFVASFTLGECPPHPSGCHALTHCMECAAADCQWCTAITDHVSGEHTGQCMPMGEVCPDDTVTISARAACPNAYLTHRALQDLKEIKHRAFGGTFSAWHPVWPLFDNSTELDWCGWSDSGPWHGVKCDARHFVREIDIQVPVQSVEEFDDPLPTSLCALDLFRLRLGSLGFGGRVPDEFTRMVNLRHLNLAGNDFVGDWPLHMTRLQNVHDLFLSGNGELPVPWDMIRVNGHHIEYLWIGYSSHTSPIPGGEFWRMEKLVTLGMFHHVGNGTLPALIFALPKMESIHVSQCQNLDVMIPDEWTPLLSAVHISDVKEVHGDIRAVLALPHLDSLIIRSSRLSGELPDTLASTSARLIDLTDNGLHGTLPPLSPHVQNFKAANNTLEGNIPPEYLGVVNVNLAHNRLTGTVPIVQASISEVNLSDNDLSGTLEDQPMLYFRGALNLSHNRLSGTLPPCTSMHEVDGFLWDTGMSGLLLQHNELEGEIYHLRECTYLWERVAFSHNHFHGTIPREMFVDVSGTVDMDHNNFTYVEPFLREQVERDRGVNVRNNRINQEIFDGLLHSSYLDLSHNEFHGTLPAGSQVALGRCDLSHNRITGDPLRILLHSFGNDVQVHLDLSHNRFTSLQIPPGSAIYVDTLLLNHNEFENSFVSGIGEAEFPLLRDLDMSHLTFELPDLSASRRTLNTYIGDHTFVPGRTYNEVVMPNSHVVSLAHCNIHRLVISRLTVSVSVVELVLAHNPLTHMSPEDWEHVFAAVTSLRKVDLSHTNVTGPLPDALFTNDKLRLADLRSSAFAIPYEPACDVDLNACLPRGLRRGELSPSADPSYSCYLPQHDAAIRFEWNTYFAHANCRCAEGFFGRRAVCHACVDGAMCPGGDAQMTMHAEAGFWGPVVDLGADTVHVSHDAVVVPDVCDGTSAMYRQCAPLHRHACATAGSGGVSSDASWQSCGGDGAYHGRMCSMCTADHFALGDECLACPSDGVVALLVLFSVAVLLGIVARALRTRHKRERAGTLSIALFYVQMIALLAWVGVPLSAPLSRLALLAAPFNLELPGWECVSAAYSFRGQFWMSVFTLPVLGVLVGGVAWLAARRGVRSASHTAVHVMTMLVLAKYMSASARVLRALGVEDGGCGVGTFFVHAPAVAADTPASRAVIGMAWMLLVVLVLGVPAWLVWVLRRKHGRQGAEHVTASSRQRYGGLFECYASRWWFWEAVVTLRKLLIAMVLGVSAYGSSMASFGVFVVLLLSAVLQRAVQPFADPLDNVLEYGSLAVLSANFALAMVFFSEDAAEGTRGLITAVLVLLNALMLVSFVFALARRRRAALLVAGRVKGSGRSRRHIGAQASLASMRSMASMREGALAAVAASDAAQGAGSSGGGSGGGGGGVRSSARAHQSPLLTNMFH